MDEGGPISGPLRSQLAEDILSEVISPEYIAIALPFASVGLGIRGTGFVRLGSAAKVAKMSPSERVAQVAANLLGTGLEPGLVRGTMRGLTAFARDPRTLSRIPQAVRNTALFKRGVQSLREVSASFAREAGGGVPGADNPLRLNRVMKDIAQEFDESFSGGGFGAHRATT
ncbi:hypothetical protein LCGC14_2892650, partial [marine sediment metagenome]